MAQDPFAFLKQEPVLVCGAGPTGLVAALWLEKFKVPFRIIDPALQSGTTTRAMIVHARTLEFYDQLGIVDRIKAAGTILQGLRIYSKGKMMGEIEYKNAASGQSKYSHVLSIGQDAQEAELNLICKERGIKIERGLQLTGAIESEDGVECTIENTQTGNTETFKASYLVGCDGARSTTRKVAGIAMTGGTYSDRSFVTDVDVASTSQYDSRFLNMNLGSESFAMVIPFTETKARIIGFVPPDRVDSEGNLLDGKELHFNDIEESIRSAAPTIKITGVDWFSTYRVHHRVADAFQSTFKAPDGHSHPGRVFICGDAGHLHSPVGGQGMNTGIGDATNLAWKLAAVHSGTGPTSLLETYATERRGFAETLVNTTDTGFQFVNDKGWKGWLLRVIVMPYFLTTVVRLFPKTQIKMFQKVSQMAISYPSSLLSTNGTGVAGSAKAGDRLPWVQIDGTKADDNFSSLQDCRWQAHVYGNLGEETTQILKDKAIPLRTFPWVDSGSSATNMASKGLGKDTLYLIRPDAQIGLICAKDDTQVLYRYLDRWDIGTQAGN